MDQPTGNVPKSLAGRGEMWGWVLPEQPRWGEERGALLGPS